MISIKNFFFFQFCTFFLKKSIIILSKKNIETHPKT